MNDRSQRRLRIALTSLAAAALVAAACGASTAHADSIVYVKDNAIWASTPNGKRQVQLAAGRRFASPSQADDGTIVALGDDNHLYHFTRGGKPIGKPVLTWLGLNGGSASRGHIGRASPPTARRWHSRSCIRKASTRSQARHGWKAAPPTPTSAG